MISFYDDIPKYDYKAGDTFIAKIPFSDKPIKCHVMYVLDGYYSNTQIDETRPEKLIIYRVFGRHKRWWHQFMEREMEMKIHRHQANEYQQLNISP